MDCKKMADRLYEFLDQEIDEKQKMEFQAHLAACEKCFDRVEFEKVLRLTIKKGIACQMPEHLKAKVLTAVRSAACGSK